MSIFSKICPRCAGDNPVDVTHCECGFVFETSATTGSYRALEMAEQEAQVYAEYLQARLGQAKETAEVAINDQARSPKDANKVAAAKSANEEHLIAKAEYDEQMKLVVELRKEAEKTQTLEHKEQESVWDKAKERTRQKALKVKEETAIKKKQEQAKLVAAKKAEKKRQQKLKAEAAAKAAADKLAARESSRTSPPPKMKKKMASAAEAAVDRVRQAHSSIEKEIAAATSALIPSTWTAATPADHPRTPEQINPSKVNSATSDDKNAPIAANTKTSANPNENECPNCTAVVPVAAKKCKCGYEFPQGAELMDSIGLSDEERANLLNMFQPGNGT